MGKRDVRRCFEQVGRALEPFGFARSDWHWELSDALFVRTSAFHDVYERVLGTTNVSTYDRVAFDTQIALTRGGNCVRGIFERAFLPIEGHDDRGWHDMTNPEQASHVASLVASLAPAQTTDLSRKKAASLLDATKHTRELASSICGRLLPDIETVTAEIRKAATTEELEFAARMRSWPAVMCVRGAEAYYETAMLAILRLGPRGPHGSPYLGVSPLYQEELNHLIQLVVDQLRFGPPGRLPQLPSSNARRKRP